MPNQRSPNTIISQAQFCQHCNKEIHDYHLHKYCSRECVQAARSAKVPIRPCPQCGNPVRAKRTDKGRVRFCSRRCKAEYYSGPNHPNWTGGRRIDGQGYVVVRTGLDERDREHRVVMESHLGRPLEPGEQVHHINGDRTDNRIENLEVMTAQEHGKLHSPGRPPKPPIICARCGRLRKHGAKGYCRSCYNRVNLEERLARDPEGTRARLKEIKHRSYMRTRNK